MELKTTEEWLQLDEKHVLHPTLPVGTKPEFVWKSGHGVYVTDMAGRDYLDASSQMTCVNLGYGRKDIADAVADQLKTLPYSSIFGGQCHPSSIQCSTKLAGLTPSGLDHFFFTSDGSESNDTAFRAARMYWHNQGKPQKHKIISLYYSYHGVSMGPVSASAVLNGRLQNGVYPLVPGFLRVPNYYCYRCPFSQSYPGCGMQCAKHLAHVIQQEGKDTIAAFIAEPVHGVAGMIVPPPEYWPMVRKICTENEVLLIADEVMTGFGRTGKMFGVDHWDVVPDMMTMAKGLTSSYLPMGAVAFHDTVVEGLKGMAMQGFTYSGHPASCAAAIKTMEIILDEKVVENAAELGAYALNRIREEFLPLPCVGEVAGLGLMIGIELVVNKETRAQFPPERNIATFIETESKKRGLILRPVFDRIDFCPPLTINREEIDRAIDIMLSIVKEIQP